MKERTLLCVSDQKARDEFSKILDRILPLEKSGFGRISILLSNFSQELSDNLPDTAVRTDVRSIRSISAKEILKEAEGTGASMIVLDVDWAASQALLKEMVRESQIPVLVMNRDALDGTMFDHVILAVDSFLPSEKDLDFFLSFSGVTGELEIIHVINEKLTVRDMLELKGSLARFRKICLDESIDAESHIYAGNTVEEIITASLDYRGTVIVMGVSPEVSRLKSMFREHNAIRVIRRSSIPVLFVPLSKGKD